MILIITHKEDFTADFLITKLNHGKIPYYRFNCEDLSSIEYSFNSSQGFSPKIGGVLTFNSVWFRRTKLPVLDSNNLSESQLSYLLYEYDALLNNFFQTISAKKWLSHPNSISIAENKLHQLAVASKIGFKIPETLVSNNKEEIVSFSKDMNGDVIIKPLKSGRLRSKVGDQLIYTNRLEVEHLAQIEDFDITPCIFQKRIAKEYELRITIVGDDIYAAKVNSQQDKETQTDWRRKKLCFTEYVLPSELIDKCKQLVSALNLSFGAVDMIKSEEGEYYFLEINPNGQWAWIEMDTGQQISNSIVEFLTS